MTDLCPLLHPDHPPNLWSGGLDFGKRHWPTFQRALTQTTLNEAYSVTFASKGLPVRVPLAPPLVGGGSCQAVAKGVLGPSVRSAGRLDLVEPCRESMVVALAPTLTVCDLLIMIRVSWRRSGCCGGEGPAAKLGAA